MNNKKTLKFCKNCGAVMVDQPDCIVCGAKGGKAVPKTTINDTVLPKIDTESVSPFQLYKQRRVPRAFAWFFILFMSLVCIGAFAYQYISFQSLNNTYNTNGAIAYQQSNSYLKIFMPKLSEPVVIDRYYNNNTSEIKLDHSFDNRFVAYMGNQQKNKDGYRGNLVLIDLTKLKNKPDSRSVEKILITDEFVSEFFFVPNQNQLIYLTISGDLYICEYTNIVGLIPKSRGYSLTKIDQGVSGIIEVKETGSLYYKTEAHDKDFELYRISEIQDQFETEKIDEKVTEVLSCDKNLSKIIYTKNNDGGNKSAYSWQAPSEITMLVEESDDFVYADVDTDQLYYYVANNEVEFSIKDAIDDDMMSGDKDLGTKEEFEQSLTEDDEKTPEEINNMRKMYAEKEERDKIRTRLGVLDKQIDKEDIFYDLYSFSTKGGASTKIGENILLLHDENSIKIDKENKNILYVTGGTENFNKIKMSTLTEKQIENFLSDDYKVANLTSEHVSETLVLYNTTSGESKNIFNEKDNKSIADFEFNFASGNIYFINYDNFSDNIGTLYSAPYNGLTTGQIVYVDDYVYAAIGYYNGTDPGLVYQIASKDDEPLYTIYNYSKSGVYEIEYDSAPAEYINITGRNNDRLFYYKKLNSDKTGELIEFKFDEPTLIGDEVSEYILFDDNRLVLIKKEGSENLDLTTIVGDKETVIDDNIGSHTTFDKKFFPAR